MEHFSRFGWIARCSILSAFAIAGLAIAGGGMIDDGPVAVGRFDIPSEFVLLGPPSSELPEPEPGSPFDSSAGSAVIAFPAEWLAARIPGYSTMNGRLELRANGMFYDGPDTPKAREAWLASVQAELKDGPCGYGARCEPLGPYCGSHTSENSLYGYVLRSCDSVPQTTDDVIGTYGEFHCAICTGGYQVVIHVRQFIDGAQVDYRIDILNLAHMEQIMKTISAEVLRWKKRV